MSDPAEQTYDARMEKLRRAFGELLAASPPLLRAARAFVRYGRTAQEILDLVHEATSTPPACDEGEGAGSGSVSSSGGPDER